VLLIAEDNPPMRRLIRALVEDLDDQIVECADGAEACRLYDAHHPDWVLMDLSMQPMDGLTAIRQILARSPGARIVVISRHDDPATRAQVREAGAVAFVSKDDLRPLRRLLGDTAG
jgi:CheY-like chemotaxis protein